MVQLHITNQASMSFGGSVQLGCNLGFLKNRLRFGCDAGHGIHSYKYDYRPVLHESIHLIAKAVNIDVNLGTDLLPKNRMDLIVSSGVRMLIPTGGNYTFNYEIWRSSQQGGPEYTSVTYSMDKNTFIAVLAKCAIRFPIGKFSSLCFAYHYSYTFGGLNNYPNSPRDLIENIGSQHHVVFGYCRYFELKVKGKSL